jgi:hypothetical protein
MRKNALLIIAVIALVSAAIAVPAAAGGGSLPSLFAKQIQKINAAPHAPAVLLPASMPLDVKHEFPTGGPSGTSYDLEIGAAKNCNGADACFVADFQAHKGGKVFGKKVTVKGASTAGYLPLSCGASCSPPQVDFIVGGVLYSIQANTGKHQSRPALISAAESAISAGAR